MNSLTSMWSLIQYDMWYCGIPNTSNVVSVVHSAHKSNET